MPQKSIEVLVQELKDNIGNVPRQAVEQALADLFEEVLEYRNSVVGNFCIPENLLQQYEIVFDDEVALRQMLERHSSRAIDQFNHVVNTRYLFALSGAMRWPNSQEASMHFSSDYKITMK
jgi:hypothetical protein